MTSLAAEMRGFLTAGLTAPMLGIAALMTAAPAQAQYGFDYDYGYRPPVERRVIERRSVRRYYGGPVYGRGFYGRDCRIVVTRRINRFGERVVVRRRICR